MLSAALSMGLFATVLPTGTASAQETSSACTSVRGALALDVARADARSAQYKALVSRENHQLSVAEQFGDSDRAQELRDQLDIDEPRLTLAKRQLSEAKHDQKILKRCTDRVAATASKGISRRSLERSLLVANETLRADKQAYWKAESDNDSYSSEQTEADLLEARANVAEDKALITRLKRAIAHLR